MRARIPAGNPLWGSPDRWKVLKMGYTFGGAHREEEDSRNSALVSLPGRRDSVRSWGMAAVKFTASPGGLVLGFLSSKRQMSWIDIARDGNEADISAVGEAEGIVVAPGGSMAMEALYLGRHEDLLSGLGEFGALAGAGLKTAPKAAPNGWCSWHFYRDRSIGERSVLENADFLRERRKELPLEVVQLDDGYQKAYGDWFEHTERFPHGIEWLAGEISRRGLVPGIWVAPFTLHARSKMAREHPDWLVRDMTGKPLAWEIPWDKGGDPWHALDAGHPEAQAWLAILFGRLYSAGYRYFKLDFLFMGCVRGARSRSITRVEAFREGLARIRAAVHGSYILACTAPYQPCAGLVDGMRTSHDINPGGNPLEAFMEAARETSHRFWAHGRLWNSDPDAVVLRPGPGMPAPATGGLAASALFSGGGIFSGDALPVLGLDRLNFLSTLLKQRRPGAGIPLDLFESERPRFISQKLGRGRFRLAIFNHTSLRRTVSFDLARLGLKAASFETLPGFGPALPGKARGRLLTPAIPPGGVIVLGITGK
jgi:alpha-galactosidase